MKRIAYAGESILTTDDVASALVELTAALARRQLSEAVQVPICDADGSNCRSAEMVIGLGNDVLAVPEESSAREPDFSGDVEKLREQLHQLTRPRTALVPQVHESDLSIEDFDFDGTR